MKKRMSVILALTMAATTMFSAVPAMAKDGDVVNITIWSPTDREQVEAWWTEKLAEWNEANPNIQVSREAIDRSDSYAYDNKIATAVTSNDLPDIFYVDGPQVSYYAANGISIPLSILQRMIFLISFLHPLPRIPMTDSYMQSVQQNLL